MMTDYYISIALGVAGLGLGFREILLHPRMASFPMAPTAVRVSMFIYSAALAGSAVLFWGEAGRPGEFAGRASMLVLVMAAALAGYNLVMLWNIAAQRYSPAAWARLNRAGRIVRASCGERRLAQVEPLPLRARR